VLATPLPSRRGVREHVRVATGRVDGLRVAVALRRGASVLSALAHADGIVTVAAEDERLDVGAEVVVEPLRDPADRLLIAGPPDPALDHLLVACAEAGLEATACDMPAADALALVAARGCHAAWVGDAPAGGALERLDVAERDAGSAWRGDAGRVVRPAGRVRLGLVFHPDVRRRDPALAVLLDVATGAALAAALAAGGHVPARGKAEAA
jgi:hypothetical protein